MPRYEYKVVPAPKKAGRVKGVKTTEGRFAHALTEMMNALGAEGWDYVRADALPCEAGGGWGKKTTEEQHMLVFRRALDESPSAEAIASVHMRAPERAAAMPVAPEPMPMPEPAPQPVMTEPAPAPTPASEPLRVPRPKVSTPDPTAARPVETVRTAFQMDPEPPAPAAPAPAVQSQGGEEPFTLPSFRGSKAEPALSRAPEGQAPRVGAARSPEAPPKRGPGFFSRG